MKKNMIAAIVLSISIVSAIASASAASYEGKIWTGKPNSPGLGYYCTAAQNKSDGNVSTHYQWAKTYLYDGSVISARQDGKNVRVVASSGKTHPKRGEGGYGESGWKTSGSFSSSAWD